MRRAEQLRRKIALYREYLSEGVSGERAIAYLREIKQLEVELEAKLDELEGKSDKRE